MQKSYISDVLLQITARPDPRLLTAAIRRALRPTFLIARTLGWAVMVVALLTRLSGDGLNVTLLLLGALLAVGVPMFLTNAGLREAMRDAELTTYEISDGGVASSSLASRHAYAWNAFSYVEQTTGQLLLGRGRSRVLPVPTADLSAAQVEQVLGAAAGHGVRVRRVSPSRRTPALVGFRR
jgi:hypothetical protein